MVSYLSPKKILSKKEYEEYVKQQQLVRRKELLEKLKSGKKNIKRFKAQQKYSKTRTGRLGSTLTRAFQRARGPSPITTSLYQKSIPITTRTVQQQYPTAPRTLKGSSGGKVGRPRGTYDKRYAAYGGVYGYRKILAAKLRAQRIELQRRATISPGEQMVINRIAFQQRQQYMNPENKSIPDTYGQVPTRNIMDEIMDAANAVR